jgi:hypothetical protein
MLRLAERVKYLGALARERPQLLVRHQLI